jgi:xanthine dehydrogenase iron-sulfur cluster and FAD-binding subunit A
MIASQALLNENNNPTRDEIAEAIEGNLCRCTGYQQIIDSIEAAAVLHRGEGEASSPASDPHPDPHPSGPEDPTMPPGHAK